MGQLDGLEQEAGEAYSELDGLEEPPSFAVVESSCGMGEGRRSGGGRTAGGGSAGGGSAGGRSAGGGSAGWGSAGWGSGLWPRVPQAIVDWRESWSDALEHWWLGLPASRHVDACLAALVLHLSSRFENALRGASPGGVFGSAGGGPAGGGLASQENPADCEWLESEAEGIELPELPEVSHTDRFWNAPTTRFERLRGLFIPGGVPGGSPGGSLPIPRMLDDPWGGVWGVSWLDEPLGDEPLGTVRESSQTLGTVRESSKTLGTGLSFGPFPHEPSRLAMDAQQRNAPTPAAGGTAADSQRQREAWSVVLGGGAGGGIALVMAVAGRAIGRRVRGTCRAATR